MTPAAVSGITAQPWQQRLAEIAKETLPLPGHGETPQRHDRLFDIACEDLSLAKLTEAHWDAQAILAEAGRTPEPGALYGVWASEVPGQPLRLQNGRLSGTKSFCSGAGLLDRALVTIGGDDGRLLDVDLRSGHIAADTSAWQVDAFRLTRTGAVTFSDLSVPADAVVGERNFYLSRPGFWHGACGPAACWAGGVAGLLSFAQGSKRDDAHTLAHLAAISTNVWAMRALLQAAGAEIDRLPHDVAAAHQRALKLRHAIDLLASDTLQRFARAYGPHPLAMQAETARRYQEAEIFLRQCHAERDLEALGRLLHSGATARPQESVPATGAA